MAGVANDLNSELGGSNSNSAVGADGVGGSGVSVVPAHSHAGRSATVVAAIPGSIVQAICSLQITLEAVKKSQRNQHGGYSYASTDDIYAALTRKMGEVGLVCISLEDRCEIKRVEKVDKQGATVTSQWAHMEYSFILATSNDTWTDARAKRTLYIQVTGPQTFQAAQSYAEKSYLRSLFKLPTGDMDLDSMPQAESEEDQNDLMAPRKRKSSYAAKKDGTDIAFNELRGAVSGADGPADLQLIKRNNWALWVNLPPKWRQIIDAEFDDRMSEFDELTDAAE